MRYALLLFLILNAQAYGLNKTYLNIDNASYRPEITQIIKRQAACYRTIGQPKKQLCLNKSNTIPLEKFNYTELSPRGKIVVECFKLTEKQLLKLAPQEYDLNPNIINILNNCAEQLSTDKSLEHKLFISEIAFIALTTRNYKTPTAHLNFLKTNKKIREKLCLFSKKVAEHFAYNISHPKEFAEKTVENLFDLACSTFVFLAYEDAVPEYSEQLGQQIAATAYAFYEDPDAGIDTVASMVADALTLGGIKKFPAGKMKTRLVNRATFQLWQSRLRAAKKLFIEQAVALKNVSYSKIKTYLNNGKNLIAEFLGVKNLIAKTPEGAIVQEKFLSEVISIQANQNINNLDLIQKNPSIDSINSASKIIQCNG